MSLFKSKQQHEQDQRVQDVLKRTDDFIERTNKILDDFERDDKRWHL